MAKGTGQRSPDLMNDSLHDEQKNATDTCFLSLTTQKKHNAVFISH